jgi:hypothetical protein
MTDQNQGPNKNEPAVITVEIDGQQVTKSAEDVQNLIAQQASATQKTQSVAAVLQTAEKYGLSPEDLVQQADGAFAVMSDLIDKGIIDNKGAIIEKKAGDVDPPAGDPPPAQGTLPKDETGLVKRLDLIEKSLAMLPGRLDTIERDQTHMIRMDLQRSIQAKHSNLSDDDVTKLFSTAMGDKSKTIWQHAESLSETKNAGVADLRKQHAEEFGINLDEFDANKLNEKDAEGGAAAVFKGKKFSFKKGEESVSPRQATMEFFKNVAKT